MSSGPRAPSSGCDGPGRIANRIRETDNSGRIAGQTLRRFGRDAGPFDDGLAGRVGVRQDHGFHLDDDR